MFGKELKELKLGLVTIVRIFMDYPVPIIIVAGSLSCTSWHLAEYRELIWLCSFGGHIRYIWKANDTWTLVSRKYSENN